MATAMISSGALDILIVRAAHTKIVTRPTVSAQLQLIFAAHPLGDFATTSLVVKAISSRRSKCGRANSIAQAFELAETLGLEPTVAVPRADGSVAQLARKPIRLSRTPVNY
jgi:hypothetical protein